MGEWIFGSIMCKLWFCCDVLFSTASILHLFMVSVNLYLSISDEYSFYYKAEDPLKSWRVRIMISSVWVVSFLISIVPITSNLYTTDEHVLHINRLDFQSDMLCSFIVNKPYRMVSSLVSFWIPGMGMIFFYSVVMRKANKMENNKLQMYNSVNYKADESGEVVPRRGSKNRNGSMGEVVWKRKYKVG